MKWPRQPRTQRPKAASVIGCHGCNASFIESASPMNVVGEWTAKFTCGLCGTKWTLTADGKTIVLKSGHE